MIYFIQAGEEGPIKIGYSREVEKRVQDLLVSNHRRLKILLVLDGDMNKERELHDLFDFAHKKGEWFWPVKSLVTFIEACKLLSQVRKSLADIPTVDIQLSRLVELITSTKDDLLPEPSRALKQPTDGTKRYTISKPVDELRVWELHQAGASLKRISQDIYGSVGGHQYHTIRTILDKYKTDE